MLMRSHRSRASILLLALGIFGTAQSQSASMPVSLPQSVSATEIDAVLMQPQGTQVAFVTHHGDLQTNSNPRQLSVVPVTGEPSRQLVTADNIFDVSWSRDGRSLYCLVQNADRYTILAVDARSGVKQDLYSSTAQINRLTVSESGRVLFTSSEKADSSLIQQRKEQGVVYDWGRDTVMDILQRHYDSGEFEDFHLVDPQSHTASVIYRLPYTGAGRHLPFIEELRLSPDGRHVGVVLLRNGAPEQGATAFNYDVGVLDLETRTFVEPLSGSFRVERALAWSSDSHKLYFLQDSALKDYDLPSHQVEGPTWAVIPEPSIFPVALSFDSIHQLARTSTHHATYTFDFRHRRVTSVAQARGLTEDMSFDATFQHYALVDQASERRPQVAVGSIGAHQPPVRRLTDLNSWLNERSLGKVERLEVVAKDGAKAIAFLVYPVGYDPTHRYPCVIGTYGFEGKFILNAEWHTTFPAQALAGQGYAVLLLNVPPSGQNVAGNPVKARDLEGWRMMSVFDRAYDLLIEKGIADPQQIGIYGWSHGGFVVEFLLTHSSRSYRAAAMGEGGDYNPSEYAAFGIATFPQIFVDLFGGPLSPQTAPAYFEFSPVLQAQKVHAPLLMEFSGRDGFFGLEMYVPLRVLGKPAELVTYDDEPHNFVTPRARLASMSRKLDWFNYWMRGQKDADPTKSAQYERWQAFSP